MVTNNAINTGMPIEVAKGGTGIATTTAYGLITGGATATGVFQTVLPGSAGTVVRSGGTGGLHTYSTAFTLTNDVMVNTAQPAFLSYLGTQDSNVTGNGTIYTLGSGNALTEVFDQGNNFTTAGVFTAPVTGRYFINASVRMGGLTAAMTYGYSTITSSNRTYIFNECNLGAIRTASVGNDIVDLHASAFIDMDAADSAYISVSIHSGAGDTADVIVNQAWTHVAGYLVC